MSYIFSRIAFTLPLIALLAAAQEPPHTGSAPFVRATGEGVVDVKPDQATISIGVVTQASTAAAAGSQNASQVATVLDRVKAEVGTKGEVRTSGYSVNPNYNYPSGPNGGAPKIVSYSASNTVTVRLDDIAIVGRIVDTAMSAGANNIHGIQFSVKDEQGVRALALKQAAQNARAAAEAIAGALGMRVVRVHAAETGAPSFVRPMQENAAPRMAAMAAAPTPVEPGNVQVHATVTVTLETAQ